MKLGALDLGTMAGYCVGEVEAGILDISYYGAYDLKNVQKTRGDAWRWIGYRNLLAELMGECDYLFFEDVPESVHSAAGAARVHGGLRATLEMFAIDNILTLVPITIQAAKRALTGTGAASKELMRKAARKRFGLYDNSPAADAADALGVLLAGMKLVC